MLRFGHPQLIQLEGFRGLEQEAPNTELIIKGAEEVKDALLQRIGYTLILDKTGGVSENHLRAVFDALQAQSLKNAYFWFDGRPIRFYATHVSATELHDATVTSHKQGAEIPFFHNIAQFVSSDPAYELRGRKLIEESTHSLFPAQAWNAANSLEVWRLLLQANLRDEGSKRFPLKLRRVMRTFFANPSSYSLDFGKKVIKEQDPNYPMLIPVIDIQFDNLPDKPLEVLESYNAKMSRAEREKSGKWKREDVLTEEEIRLADQCFAVVNFVDGAIYNTFELPRAAQIVAAPLLPYEHIMKRAGYVYEKWLGFGPNDELAQAITGAAPLEV